MATRKTKYRMDYYTSSRKETTFHATRDAAMTAGYARLDLEQRDALALGEQGFADTIGRERGAMASSWQKAVKGRDVLVYAGNRLRIYLNRD